MKPSSGISNNNRISSRFSEAYNPAKSASPNSVQAYNFENYSNIEDSARKTPNSNNNNIPSHSAALSINTPDFMEGKTSVMSNITNN